MKKASRQNWVRCIEYGRKMKLEYISKQWEDSESDSEKGNIDI